jgi:hypothetical protein
MGISEDIIGNGDKAMKEFAAKQKAKAMANNAGQ